MTSLLQAPAAGVTEGDYSKWSLLSDTHIAGSASGSSPSAISIDIPNQIITIVDTYNGVVYALKFDGSDSGMLTGSQNFFSTGNWTQAAEYQNAARPCSIFAKYLVVNNAFDGTTGNFIIIKKGVIIQTQDDSSLVGGNNSLVMISWDGQYIVHAFNDVSTSGTRVRVYKGS